MASANVVESLRALLVSIVRDHKPERASIEAGVTVKFGLDVHAAQITVCRQIEGQLPQPAQKLGWTECVAWIEAYVRAGAVVHSCYEAGQYGYGLHRRLTALGVTKQVERDNKLKGTTS